MYFRGRSLRKYIQHEGGTIPYTAKTMRQLDRPTAEFASVLKYVYFEGINFCIFRGFHPNHENIFA